MRANTAVSAAVAAVATYFAAATFPCPPLLTPKRIQQLAVGANASDARAVVLAQGWSWRRSLARELGVGQAYDADGHVTSCAADAAEDALVYHGHESSPTPQWHWPSEKPGHERVVSLQRGFGNVTMLTLSAAPPLFLVRGLLTTAEADVLAAIAEPALRAARVRMAPGGSLQPDERRTGETAWLHGAGNDPRREVAEATRLQQRVLRLLRMHSAGGGGGGGGGGGEAGHASSSSIAAALEAEAAAASAGRVEPVQVEAFGVGHSYEPHVDYQGQPTAAVGARAHDATRQPPHGSNRLATVRVWLSDAADGEGGHEVFPFARAAAEGGDRDSDGGSDGGGGGGGGGGGECALVGCVEEAGAPGAPPCDFPAGEGLSQRRGLMARPRKGDALVWYSQTADGQLDGRTRHGTCPVLAGGRQLAATVWVWNRRVLYG